MESLIGDARKARKKLNWKPRKNIHKLIDEMIEEELKKIKTITLKILNIYMKK